MYQVVKRDGKVVDFDELKTLSFNDYIDGVEPIKGDNDAKYNSIISSFTLETVKEEALNRLGMHYADADQVQYYHLVQDSYVRQYQEVTQAD